MIKLFELATEVQTFCEERGWQFCFIGGLALQVWGEPRETIDVDLTLLTGIGDELVYIRELMSRFQPRFPNTEEFALRRRVVLLQGDSGAGLDVAMGALQLEIDACSRARPVPFPGGHRLRVCTAEDLVVLKAIAGRPRDWLDIEGVIVKQTGRMDWEYILRQADELAEIQEDWRFVEDLKRRREEFEK